GNGPVSRTLLRRASKWKSYLYRDVFLRPGRWPRIARQPPQLGQIDAVQQHRQLARPQFQRRLTGLDPRQLENARLQPLVPERESVPLPNQDLQPVTALGAKQEKM